MDSKPTISDSPRLSLTLLFIEGIGVWLFALRQLSYGGPYGEYLGLSFSRFGLLLTLLVFLILLGILLSRQDINEKTMNWGVTKVLLAQTKWDKLMLIPGGFITVLAIAAFYNFTDLQYRVAAVIVAYLGFIIPQKVIVRYCLASIEEKNKFTVLLAHPIIKRTSPLMLILGCALAFCIAFWYRISSGGLDILSLGISRYEVIYLIETLMISMGLGVLLVKLNKWILVPAISRFWFGFCAAPFVIGFWVLGLTTLYPGSQRWIFLLPLPFSALLIIGIWGKQAFKIISDEYVVDKSNNQPPKVAILLYLVAAFVSGAVVATLILNSRHMVIDRDALRYLAEGLAIAQSKSLDALSVVKGSPMGIVFGDHHGFMFPAILSHALLVNGGNAPGYPHDEAARLSFQLLIIYMFLSILSLTGINRRKGTGIITWLLLLGVPTLGVISYGSYRDPLRILSYILLTTVLTGLSPQNLKSHLSWKPLIILLIIAGFCISSHGSSALIAAMLLMAWIIWQFLGSTNWLNTILVVIFFGIGCLGGGYHIILGYIQTGVPMGVLAENVLYLNELTPGIDRGYEPYGNAEGLTLTQGLLALLARDNYQLSISGLVAISLSFILWLRDRKSEKRNNILFYGLLIFTITLPFLGVFDTRYYHWSESYVYNYRYSLHWYPFAAACIAVLATSSDIWVKTEWMKKFLYCLTIISAVLYGIFSYQVIMENWAVQRENSIDYVTMLDNITLHKQTMDQLPTGQMLLIDDQVFNYYLGNQAILFLTPPTKGIAQAQDVREVHEGLEKLKIGALIFYQNNFFDYYDRTALFEYLDNPYNAFILFQNKDLRAYVIEQSLVSSHNSQIKEAQSNLNASLSNFEEVKYAEAIAAYQKAVNTFPNVIKTISSQKSECIFDLVQFVTKQDENHYLDKTSLQPMKESGFELPPEQISLAKGSIAFWGKFDNTKLIDIKLAQINPATNDLSLALSKINDIYYFYYYYHNQLVGRFLILISDNAYHYYVFTWQDEAQRMYIDGEHVMIADYPANLQKSDQFYINWPGEFLEIKVYNRALTSDEVSILSDFSH